jgi:leucyl-tRNA synthetase
MDTFVESAWYYVRFLDPKWGEGAFRRDVADAGLPVDLYIGGIEHACMHLLYARFFHKVLRDWGYLSGNEPFKRLLSQGMVVKDGAKMSKSKGNVVSPVAIVDTYGADTARLFSLFAAPPEKDLDWNEKGVEGCARFLQRFWRLCSAFQGELVAPGVEEKSISFSEEQEKLRRKTHWMIRKITDDVEDRKFNVAVSAAMETVNEFYAYWGEKKDAFSDPASRFILQEGVRALIRCLAPFTPHICEELWEALGEKEKVSETAWPDVREDLLVEDSFLLIVQVNGKLRDKASFPKNASAKDIERAVLALPKLAPYLEGKTVKKFIYVPERLANVVVA